MARSSPPPTDHPPHRSHHRTRRAATRIAAVVVSLLTTLALATPAAAVNGDEKLAVLSDWTQTSAASYTAWNAARTDRADWSSYAFDWSTDYCSASPDNPLGFDFRLACHRHDFGYRNYKVTGLFPAAKPRLDKAFHADLKRRCGTYTPVVRPACLSLAWTYYQAVKRFGSTAAVSRTDLDRAARLKAEAERAAAHP